ncbi:hypothetical protein HCN44_006112 [Aphidius gifuensis]|uniref:Chaoptin n=1 Tax=Aphidius gifuensis TaxID=684658 RepID=A0A834Y2R0_APHGI|nr:hypothetical protein HCN44_006112 [Aphidius gifuensis]
MLLIVSPIIGEYIAPGPRYKCPDEKNSINIYPCVCIKGTDNGLIVQCENTNLASLSVAFSNLATEAVPIEELVISKCDIARFYGPALYQLDVRVLKILDTPLKYIEQHSFLGVNRTLQELYIHQSNLIKFPKEALQILGNLSILSISGHHLTELEKDSFTDSMVSVKLEKLEISNGLMSIISPASLTPLKKLKTLNLNGNKITELNRNQFKGLRDTESLDLSNNSIRTLDPSHFMELTKMGWCNLSRNAIGDLKRGTFSRNTVLKVLNLSHNKIKKIDTNTFKGMRFLRRLYLDNNEINDVGRGTFESTTRIGTIDLSKNAIKAIKYQMFYQLQHVELIDVSNNHITNIEKNAFVGLILAKVNLSNNEITNLESGSFENCINITNLDLSYNKISNISKYAFDETTYATEIQLSYNFLTSLNQVPLQNMTGLKLLNVSNNLIRSIPRNTFPKLYELHTIDLAYNNLSDIHNGIFQTLFSLRLLNLSHNSMEEIKSSTFGTLPTLLELDLSYNNLSIIANGGLAKLSGCRYLTVKNNKLQKIFQLPISLAHLDYSNNKLTEIPTVEIWPSMNSLLHLDLSMNQLGDNLHYGSFEPLLTLRILNLQGNNITLPPWAALSTLTSLQYLYMEDNNITSLSKKSFGQLPIVFELNVAHNKIRDITINAFEGLLQLLTLNLTNNDIKFIPVGAFKGLVSLRILDISYNQIERLDNKTHALLNDCLSLEKINLSHNRISFISKHTFPSDPWISFKLKEIDLSYNSISVISYDLTIGTRKVITMNLSNNHINEIRQYVIGNLTAIETLDLSYNDLTDISDDNIFHPPNSLMNLNLQNNFFTHLPIEKIVKLPKLKELNLQFNNLTSFDNNILKIIKNSTILKFKVKRWLTSLSKTPLEWSNVTCVTPNHLASKLLIDSREELMSCEDKKFQNNTDLQIAPDIKFRNVEYFEEDDYFIVTWYVTSRGDIGDFYIVVKEVGKLRSIIEKDIVYNERSYKLRGLSMSTTNYELCILARDSTGNVKHYRNSQCRILNKPSSLSSMGFTLNFNLSLIIINICLFIF